MTPQEQRADHISKCEFVRQNAIVRDIATGNIMYDGFNAVTDFKQFGSIPCKGINAAKRFIRKSGQRSYTV